jgi:hypothetical protein
MRQGQCKFYKKRYPEQVENKRRYQPESLSQCRIPSLERTRSNIYIDRTDPERQSYLIVCYATSYDRFSKVPILLVYSQGFQFGQRFYPIRKGPKKEYHDQEMENVFTDSFDCFDCFGSFFHTLFHTGHKRRDL